MIKRILVRKGILQYSFSYEIDSKTVSNRGCQPGPD